VKQSENILKNKVEKYLKELLDFKTDMSIIGSKRRNTMNQIQEVEGISWFGIPIWKGKPKTFITEITTSNWNKYHENVMLRRNELVKNINECKDETALVVLRKSLKELELEKDIFCNGHVIND